jgi:hypothetical protein
MRAARTVFAMLAVTLATPAAAQPTCAAPQKPMLDIELMLGHGRAGEARWERFLARAVTSRFPDGLTVYQATGQWRDPRRGTITRDQTRVLRIVVPRGADVRDKIAAIEQGYKREFRQKSVGIVMREVCASF